MATFNDATVGTSTGGTTPDFGASRKSQPVVRKVQFGDGYEQRLTYGLNQNPRIWDLTWTARDNVDADAIEAFFDARAADNASFDWIPLNEATTYKWVVESWSRDLRYANVNTITATFRQVFEP
jgi:phage-related protein